MDNFKGQRLTRKQWQEVADLMEQCAVLVENEFSDHSPIAKYKAHKWLRNMANSASKHSINAQEDEE